MKELDKQETLKKYIHSGNQLREERKLNQAIQQYQEALKFDPNFIPALNCLAVIYASQKQLDQAFNYRSLVAQLQPDNARAQMDLATVMLSQSKIKEAIVQYQKAITLTNPPPYAFAGMGDALEKDSQLDKAITAYQKAIELSPDYYVFHLRIASLYSKIDQFDRAIDSYQQGIKLQPDVNFYYYLSLAKILKQQGREEEAIVWINASKEGKNYSRIWEALNQTSLETFEEESSDFPSTLNQNNILQYFDIVSQYKIINLEALSEEDLAFLEANNISLANLELIVDDEAAQQEVYLKHFNHDHQIKSWQSSHKERTPWLFQQDYRIDFQQSMIETGYIYTICPISGKILRSNRSFVTPGGLGKFFGIYHFQGEETFYLLAAHLLFNLDAIYFPRLDTIILLTRRVKKDQWDGWLNNWKRFMVTRWRKVFDYLQYEGQRSTVVAGVSQINNIAHNLVNDLSGIDKLSQAGMLAKVDKFICDSQEYFGKLEDIFPEIDPENVIRMHFSKVPEFTLENQYFILGLGDKKISADLAQRINRVSIKKCHQSSSLPLEEAKKCFPLIWISFRLHNRFWISQVEGTANIINKLAEEFPNLGVVFDGFSLADCHANLAQGYPSFVKEQIEKEKLIVQQILSLVPNKNIGIYDLVGCRLHESIVWASAVDFFIASMGANLAKICTIANKPGIGHCCTGYIPAGKVWWNAARENGVDPIFISPNHITDTNSKDNYQSNYDLDWKVIYDESIKLIPNLSRNRHHQ